MNSTNNKNTKSDAPDRAGSAASAKKDDWLAGFDGRADSRGRAGSREGGKSTKDAAEERLAQKEAKKAQKKKEKEQRRLAMQAKVAQQFGS